MDGDGARRRSGWEFGGVCAGDGSMVAVTILVLSRAVKWQLSPHLNC